MKLVTPGRGGQFNPKGIILKTSVEDLKLMLRLKYESSRPCAFRQEHILRFSLFESYVKFVTPGTGLILTPGT